MPRSNIFVKNKFALSIGSRPSYKTIIGIFILGLIFIFGLIMVIWALIPLKIASSNPKDNSQNVALSQNLEISFNLPINRSRMDVSLAPDIQGSWQFEDKLLGRHLARRMIFSPSEYFVPGQQYTISIKNAGSIVSGLPKKEFTLHFTAQNLPEISGFSITNGQSDVEICNPITANLDTENDNLASFNFSLTPVAELTSTLSPDKKSYSIKPADCLPQGTDYQLSIERSILTNPSNPNFAVTAKKITDLKFKTKSAPGIADYSPKGEGVLIRTTKFTLNFTEEMNQNEVISNISVSPSISGSWKWNGIKEIDFTALEKLKYDTLYTIMINKNVHDLKGGFISDDTNLIFRTIGYVKVTGFSPAANATNVSSGSPISITFNQDVDHASAQSRLQISPAISGTFSWVGTKMTFNPDSPLQNNGTYQISVLPGIKSVNGLDSISSFSSHFSTAENIVNLSIAQHYQDKPLSCEAASLRMALSYRGISVSENDIMNEIGFDPTPRSGSVWGNPNLAFVGNINGQQDTTGYGVYWDPIAKAANHYRSAKAFTGWTLSQLAQSLTDGNPVVAWGVFGSHYYSDPWTTPDGISITAWKGEHARVVTGFKGSVQNPSQFYLNDPVAGKIVWTSAQMQSNWSTFNDSGVVVY